MCYRRSDSADIAGRIYDRLVIEFGKSAVFRDVDAIPYGVDFREHIRACLNTCLVALVVIGPDWVTTKGSTGQPRLQEGADHVRAEVEAMFARADIAIIPLMVRGAAVPQPEALPESMRLLAYRNGPEIRRDPDFHADVDRLIRQMREILPEHPLQLEPVGTTTQQHTEPAAESTGPVPLPSTATLPQTASGGTKSDLAPATHPLHRALAIPFAPFRYVLAAWREAWAGQKAGERAAMVMLGLMGLVGCLVFAFLDSKAFADLAPTEHLVTLAMIFLADDHLKMARLLSENTYFSKSTTDFVYCLIGLGAAPVIFFLWNLVRERLAVAWVIAFTAHPILFSIGWAGDYYTLFSSTIMTYTKVCASLFCMTFAVSSMILLVWIPPFLRYPAGRFRVGSLFMMKPRERGYAAFALFVAALFALPGALSLAGYQFHSQPNFFGITPIKHVWFNTMTLVVPIMAGLTFARERARWAIQYLFTLLVIDSAIFAAYVVTAIVLHFGFSDDSSALDQLPVRFWWAAVAFHAVAFLLGLRVIRRGRPAEKSAVQS